MMSNDSALSVSQSRLPVACVIFDIDGTLAQTNELIFASFNHVAAKYLGRTFSPKEIVAMFGPPEEGALQAAFGDRYAPRAMEELVEFYRAHHGTMASLHPGINELLKFLKENGITLAVFTGKGKTTARITLEALGILRYFDLVVSGNDVASHKPDPEGIRKVIDHFHFRPGEVLMVGDSLGDIRAARGAGVRMALVVWDSYDRERVLAAGAEDVFHSPAEMLDWFRSCLRSGDWTRRPPRSLSDQGSAGAARGQVPTPKPSSIREKT